MVFAVFVPCFSQLERRYFTVRILSLLDSGQTYAGQRKFVLRKQFSVYCEKTLVRSFCCRFVDSAWAGARLPSLGPSAAACWLGGQTTTFLFSRVFSFSEQQMAAYDFDFFHTELAVMEVNRSVNVNFLWPYLRA